MDISKYKTMNDWDCRAVSEEFLSQLKKGGNSKGTPLYYFTDLVKKHKELSFCFRGNGGTDCVIIYRNNHAMFKITPRTVYFNPNFLRYCSDWEQKLNQLHAYGFGKGKNIELDDVKTSTRGKSCSFKDSPVFSANINRVFIANLEDIYSLMTEIFDDYFCMEERCLLDQFLLSKGIKEKSRKIEHLEKDRQQQLFAEMKCLKDGYYSYDAEFQQKHKGLDELHEDIENGVSNKPDMLALRMNSEGHPEAIVSIEVKCTRSAYYGKSGVKKHIESMRKYPEKNTSARRREAFLIIRQYNELGLYNAPELEPEEFENLPLEQMLIFTDEAIKLWKNDASMEEIKKKQAGGIGYFTVLKGTGLEVLVVKM